jgi:cell division protein FtsL
MNARLILLGLMVLLAVGSSLGVVYAKHAARKEFVQLQELNRQRDAMQVEWGRLQLEQSTLADHARVEPIARRRLGMRMPDAGESVIARVGAVR